MSRKDTPPGRHFLVRDVRYPCGHCAAERACWSGASASLRPWPRLSIAGGDFIRVGNLRHVPLDCGGVQKQFRPRESSVNKPGAASLVPESSVRLEGRGAEDLPGSRMHRGQNAHVAATPSPRTTSGFDSY